MKITSNIQKTPSIISMQIKRIKHLADTYWFTGTMYGGFFCAFE